MTDIELLQKADQIHTMLLGNYPYADQKELVIRAYLGGLNDGGQLVSAHLQGLAATQKARIT